MQVSNSLSTGLAPLTHTRLKNAAIELEAAFLSEMLKSASHRTKYIVGIGVVLSLSALAMLANNTIAGGLEELAFANQAYARNVRIEGRIATKEKVCQLLELDDIII